MFLINIDCEKAEINKRLSGLNYCYMEINEDDLPVRVLVDIDDLDEL